MTNIKRSSNLCIKKVHRGGINTKFHKIALNDAENNEGPVLKKNERIETVNKKIIAIVQYPATDKIVKFMSVIINITKKAVKY